MKSEEVKGFVVAQLEELQALDIVVLNIARQTTIADFFIISCGTSKRHRRAIAERVIEVSKLNGINVPACEGYEAAEWILIDLGDVVLHVMQQETRTRYDLEGLWQDTGIYKAAEHADAH